MPARLGGMQISPPVRWVSSTAIAVRFTSTYGATRFHQLYAGRQLIGVTSSRSSRRIIGQLKPSTYPQPLQLAAVDPADRLTDFGSTLPRSRAYNRVRMQIATSSYPADAKFIDVTAGTEPGGAVDSSNRIGRILFDTDRTYVFITEPLGPGGTWNFEAAGVDDKLLNGNTGAALALSQAIETAPPDVGTASDGNRLTVSIASQQATIGFTP